MRRHLEAAELDQPESAGRGIGRVELVDAELRAVRVAGDVHEQVPEDAVDEPGSAVAAGAESLDLGEGELELVDAVGPRLVDPRRLARRPDEHAGEEERQRRMVVPVRQKAAQ